MHSSFLSRIRIVSVLVGLIVLLIIVKLFFVQVVHSARYAALADHSYATPTGGVFDRGTIFFTERTDDRVAAATTLEGYQIEVNIAEAKDIPAIVGEIAKYIDGFDSDGAIKRLSSSGAGTYRVIARRVPRNAADSISGLKIAGVYVKKDAWRVYPGNELASQTIGFVAYKGDELSGRYGLERYYNDVLARAGTATYVNFFAEIFSNIKSTFFENPQKEGDVVTTLDPTLLGFLTKRLEKAKNDWSADSAGAIVIDPSTGALYALSTLPTYDANAFQDVTDQSLYQNSLAERVYEWGSVVKPLIMAAGLDSGAVTPETKYTDYTGFVTVNGQQIYNFDKKGRGVATMQDVLNQSLNTGMVFVAGKLGHEKMRDYIGDYKLGEKTGIDLPGEIGGLLSNIKSNRDIEFATMAFGQGIALTPFELVRALSALANGGHIITPHIASKIEYTDGTEKIVAPPASVDSIWKDPKTSETITRMLVTVADGTMKTYGLKLPHYALAAKTGTAQIPNDAGGYYEDRHLHSIFGYVPAYDPKFLIFMFLKNPKGAQFAAQSLAAPLVDVATFITNYYGVAPDRE